MSLDIAILGPNGSPKKKVSIGVDEHCRLMQLADGSGGLLTRLHDYYGDAEFEHSELDPLIAELTRLAARSRDDEPLFAILKSLAELIETAKSEGKALLVIAD